MTSNVSSSHADVTPSRHTGMRVVVGLLGLAALVVGVVLLFNPVAAARSLALLLGLSFIVGGLLEIAVGWDAEKRRGASFALGAVLVIAGVLAAVWPGVTLFTLALIGLALMARHEIPGWGWLVLAGAVNVVIGVIAIAWPQATVLVLCLILGAQIAVFGLLLLIAAFVPPGARAGAHAG
jgi:hypothetical protein